MAQLTPAEQERAQEISERVHYRMASGQNFVKNLQRIEQADAEIDAQKVQVTITEEPANPLEGQTTLPGFDPPQKKPLSANAVLKNMNQVSFKMEYLKSPEDALIAWDAPQGYLSKYLETHFEAIVKHTAAATGADPEQIRDKDRRTPVQQRMMNEIAAQMTLRRFDAFFESLFYSALEVVEPLPGFFDGRSAIEDNVNSMNQTYHKAENAEEIDPSIKEASGGSYPPPTKEQAAVYFFAIHEELDPTAAGKLSEEQTAELQAIFQKLDSFYYECEKNKGKPLEQKEQPRILRKFVMQEHPPQQSKFSKAEDNGAIMTIGERLFVPTDPEYMDAFTTSNRANIGFFRKDQKSGARQLATDVNPLFMQALAKTVLVDIYNGNQEDTIVYFPTFARELGYEFDRYKEEGTAEEKKADPEQEAQDLTLSDRAKARKQFINQKLAEWDSIWGVLPRSMTEYKLMALHTYNPETEEFTFQSPYLKQLISALIEKEEDKLSGGKHYHLWNSDLLHASAASDRNPAAVEMATRILQGVQQRGQKPDNKLKQNRGKQTPDESLRTFHISCKRLIQDCPQIREDLKKLPDANRKTKLLKRAFSAMYRILRTKSDLFTYYKDLTITEVIPTSRTLDTNICITHHGGNPNYKKPFLPLSAEDPEEEAQAEPEPAD